YYDRFLVPKQEPDFERGPDPVEREQRSEIGSIDNARAPLSTGVEQGSVPRSRHPSRTSGFEDPRAALSPDIPTGSNNVLIPSGNHSPTEEREVANGSNRSSNNRGRSRSSSSTASTRPLLSEMEPFSTPETGRDHSSDTRSAVAEQNEYEPPTPSKDREE
ncbi:hypothetical protein V5O48_019632, partial [Marasmius crinis-equi]